MRRKKVIIKRLSAAVLRPKKLKPFSLKGFLKSAEKLEKAIKREEEMYGSPRDRYSALS